MTRHKTVLKGLSVASGSGPLRLQALPASSDAPAHVQTAESAPTGVVLTLAELEARLDAARQEGAALAAESAQAAAREAMEAQLARRLERIAKDQAEKWRQLAMALAGQMVEVRERFEADVAQAVFVATCRLVGETAFSEKQVAHHVRQVLVEAGMPESARVLLHRDDLGAVLAAQQHAPDDWPEQISFAADGGVAVGGCLIETDVQQFDARLEVQLALLHERLELARAQRSRPDA